MQVNNPLHHHQIKLCVCIKIWQWVISREKYSAWFYCVHWQVRHMTTHNQTTPTSFSSILLSLRSLSSSDSFLALSPDTSTLCCVSRPSLSRSTSFSSLKWFSSPSKRLTCWVSSDMSLYANRTHHIVYIYALCALNERLEFTSYKPTKQRIEIYKQSVHNHQYTHPHKKKSCDGL